MELQNLHSLTTALVAFVVVFGKRCPWNFKTYTVLQQHLLLLLLFLERGVLGTSKPTQSYNGTCCFCCCCCFWKEVPLELQNLHSLITALVFVVVVVFGKRCPWNFKTYTVLQHLFFLFLERGVLGTSKLAQSYSSTCFCCCFWKEVSLELQNLHSLTTALVVFVVVVVVLGKRCPWNFKTYTVLHSFYTGETYPQVTQPCVRVQLRLRQPLAFA